MVSRGVQRTVLEGLSTTKGKRCSSTSKLMLQGPASPPLEHVIDTHHSLGRVHTDDPLPLCRGKKVGTGGPQESRTKLQINQWVFFLSKAGRFLRLHMETRAWVR